jgi:hypothetical protein
MVSDAVARPGLPAERLFYLSMIAALWVSVLLGFSRSFFLRPLFPMTHSPPEAWFYVHGAVFTAWMALLAAQAGLVAGGNTAMHRRLGAAGLAFVPAMVVLATVGGLIAARRPGGFIDIPVPPLQFLTVPFAGAIVFAILAGLGLALRRRPQAHKRLMLIATMTLVEAAIARWPFDFVNSPNAPFWTACAFLIPLVMWDLRTRRRPHPATLWGGLLLVASGPLRDWAAGTAAWLGFAKWAVGLLG